MGSFPEFRDMCVKQLSEKPNVATASQLSPELEVQLGDVFRSHAGDDRDRVPKDVLVNGIKRSMQALKIMRLQQDIQQKASDEASREAIAFIFQGIGGSPEGDITWPEFRTFYQE